MSSLAIIRTTVFFLLLSIFGVAITLQSMTNVRVANLFTPQEGEVLVSTDERQCSERTKIPGLEQSQNVHLLKLSEYQAVCGSFAANRLMVFTTMPKDENESVAMAAAMAQQLNQFKAAGVTPVVVVEPESSWGLIDFNEFRDGFYTSALTKYFEALQQQGITSQDMGIWVPFPEANLPYWNKNGFDNNNFGDLINIYLGTLKRYFPAAHGSVLLNSTSYDEKDFDFARGDYRSLKPYLAKIQPGLVDSMGIQGFPWLPRATTPGRGITEAAEYLNPRLMIEAADLLKVKEVWFNTGTFQLRYANDETNTVFVDANTRKAWLSDIADQSSRLKEKGYSVWVNLFAEDKSGTQEATDWSYWNVASDRENPHRFIFIDAVRRFNQLDIPVSLYDKAIQK
jgi:hypothetical protein